MKKLWFIWGSVGVALFLVLGCSSGTGFSDPSGDSEAGESSGELRSSSGTGGSDSVESSGGESSSSGGAGSQDAQSSSSSQTGEGTSSVSEWCQTEGNCGTFVDSRDGTTYRWTKIGTQVWMAQGLNFGTREVASINQQDATAESAEKYCFGGSSENCAIDGGLYQWHSIMAFSLRCSTTNPDSSTCVVHSPHRGICPEGWHVPTNEEWDTLEEWVDLDNDGEINNNAGVSLRAASGWDDDGNGTDAYGWAGLPGGFRDYGDYRSRGILGYWWSASILPSRKAGSRRLYGGDDLLYYGQSDMTTYGFSVRCLQDEAGRG